MMMIMYRICLIRDDIIKLLITIFCFVVLQRISDAR
jgi:hypothetical protein